MTERIETGHVRDVYVSHWTERIGEDPEYGKEFDAWFNRVKVAVVWALAEMSEDDTIYDLTDVSEWLTHLANDLAGVPDEERWDR